MKWTTTPPTKTGWYWHRTHTGRGTWSVGKVITIGNILCAQLAFHCAPVTELDWQWWPTPIPEPVES